MFSACRKPRFFFLCLLVLLGIFISYQSHAQLLIYTIAGNGSNGISGDNGPATCAGTPNTSGVCLDGKGNLYLTSGNTVRKVNLASGIITTIAGTGASGHSGDGGQAINASMQFPVALCSGPGDNLYISEWGGHYVRKMNTVTGIITTVAGNGTGVYAGDGGAATAASVNRPQGLACDAAGNLYFADMGNSRIRKIDAATGIITTFAGNGSTTHSGDGGLATSAGIPFPVDVCIRNNNLYFIEVFGAATCRVRKIDMTTNIVTTVAGRSSYAYGGDGGAATQADLFDPTGIAVDAAGNIFIAEYDDSRIRKVDAATGIINTIAGTGTNGFGGDNGPAINAILNNPKQLALDTNGDLYVADGPNHRIRKLSTRITTPTANATTVTIAAASTIVCPNGQLTFTSTVTNAGTGINYNWIVNGRASGNSQPIFISNNLHAGDVVTCEVTSLICNALVSAISNAITLTGGSGQTPTISITADNATICRGQAVTFSAIAQNVGADPSYQWKLNGVNVGSDDNYFTSTTLVNNDQVSCVVTADPATTCASSPTANSNTITITVNTATAPSISIAASDNNVCPGNEIVFTATLQDAGASPIYTWKINGVTTGTNSPTFTSSSLMNNDAVTCEIKANSPTCGLVTAASTPVLINIKAQPVVKIVPADTIVKAGVSVQLQTIVSGTLSSFEWTPAALLSNTSLSPTTLPIVDDVLFQIKVTSVNGCSAMATSNIKIALPLFMPTAFTPNGDGINDIYRIPPQVNINLKEFSIYDRWGNRVFYSNDIGKGWDGTQNGKKKDSGVFIYVITGTDDKGAVFKKGSFMLIR